MSRTLNDLEKYIFERRPAVKDAVERAMPRVRIASVLKRIRRAAGLSQRDLADRIGLHQPAIARIESGVGEKPQTNDAILAYAQGCSMAVGLVFLSKENGRYKLQDAVPLTDDEDAEAFLQDLVDHGEVVPDSPCRAAGR
jgi:transcriptional regulator with XRE-family HTH domain